VKYVRLNAKHVSRSSVCIKSYVSVAHRLYNSSMESAKTPEELYMEEISYHMEPNL